MHAYLVLIFEKKKPAHLSASASLGPFDCLGTINDPHPPALLYDSNATVVVALRLLVQARKKRSNSCSQFIQEPRGGTCYIQTLGSPMAQGHREAAVVR